MLTCIAMLTLFLVHASNGQDIMAEEGDPKGEGPADIQASKEVREYHAGDSIEITCKNLEKYKGEEPVIWRTLPDENELPENHEVRGGVLLLRQIQTNLTGVFCLVKRGSLT